jgi:2-polyprenyl-6-methoxyphenol hydroxylase-like FAD-dependent oxidoreductase
MLNKHLKQYESSVERLTYVKDIKVIEDGCLTTLSTGKKIKSSYVIGADGSSSFVRNHFKIAFDVVYPQIIWAVIDGIIDTNFPKVPEIIVFQVETSDVAGRPRERNLDRFYVRMDRKDFALEEVIKKINKAIKPYHLNFREIVWFSQFSVKESVAENFFVYNRIFLAGDSAHIHSVNGGQGLNTGLADAFNLMWKINLVINFHVSKKILKTYEQERKPIALSVINSSGELVRSTKYSPMGTHAEDYVRIVQKYAGNITGMGIRYGTTGIVGTRLFDLELYNGSTICRLYSLLNYQTFHLLVFGLYDKDILILPAYVKVLHIPLKKQERGFWTKDLRYAGQAILVRSDAYIEAFGLIEEVEILIKNLVEKMA